MADKKKATEEDNLSLTNEQILESDQLDANGVETQVVKVGEKSQVKLNKFDIFFIRIWSFICSAILKLSDWICKGIKFATKRDVPRRYVVAVVSAIILILLLVLLATPFTRTVSEADDFEVYNSNLVAVQKLMWDSAGNPIYKWGYANKNGDIKIECQYEYAMDFKYSVAFVLVTEETGNSTYSYWKLINTKGKNVGSYQFPQTIGADWVVEQFSSDNKLAKVCLAGSYGYVNTKGKMQIEAEYDDAGTFIDGKARVGRGSAYYFINTKGKQLSDEYSYARDFVEGYAAVKTLSGNWKFINSNCQDITEAKFDLVSDFKSGYAAVKVGGSYAIINTSGEYVVKPNLFYDLSILEYFDFYE